MNKLDTISLLCAGCTAIVLTNFQPMMQALELPWQLDDARV